MSFYGTSFYELKQYFKRFLFQNGTDEPITFEPSDIFDGLKQKSDHWIRFDKDEEELPDGTNADILLISHNIPNKEDVEIGGLRFYNTLEDAYQKDIEKKISRFFNSIYHKEIVKLVNNSKKNYELGVTFVNETLDFQIYALFKDIKIDLTKDIEIINTYFIDYLKITALNVDEETGCPKGPYVNNSNDLIIENILSLINPDTIASLPDFDIDKRGHMIFKGNKVFTFPDNIIGFIDPNTNEIIKISPKNTVKGDGSYILFSGNDYIDFTYNENTGALQINHKKGSKGDGIERKSTIPKYFNNIQEAIYILSQEGIRDQKGEEYTSETLREKIQSYRSGNILQIPNFSYDEYGHLIQDSDNPYNYLRLDMADSYQIVNFAIKFTHDWALVNDDTEKLAELSIYQRSLTPNSNWETGEDCNLSNYVNSIETVFNVACDNKTRLRLIQAGISEFWIDNIQGTPVMFVRGEASAFNNQENDKLFAFQVQVINSYESAAAAEGINGAVIVQLGYNGKEDYSDYGVCSHTYDDIINHLEQGKMVLCYEPGNGNYYVPSGRGFNDPLLGNYITFTRVTNKNNFGETKDLTGLNLDTLISQPDNWVPVVTNGTFDASSDSNIESKENWISSIKVVIPQGLSAPPENTIINDVLGLNYIYFRVVDYNLGAKINDFIGKGDLAIDEFKNKGDAMINYYEENVKSVVENIIKDKIEPFYITNVELATLQEIKDKVSVSADIYYQNESGINIPLSGLSDSQAIFSINTISNDVLTIQTYIINSIGELTTQTYEVATSRMLPTGGITGQILMINTNGIPEWTSFLRINTNDDNLIEYHNNGTWEPVSASWA